MRAGSVKGGKLVEASGQPMRFEILLSSPDFERVTLPFAKQPASASASRQRADGGPGPVPESDRRLRLRHDDRALGSEPVAGQRAARILGSKAADTQGSQNLAGIEDPVVDALIEKDHRRR